jgi:hypothetical protein
MSEISLDSEKLSDADVVADVRKQKMILELSEKKNVELRTLEQQYEADRSVIIKKYEDYEATL